MRLGGPSASAQPRDDTRFEQRKELSARRLNFYSPAMRTILLIVLILLLIGVFPGWGYSSGWGYYPFSGVGLLLLIIIILALMGKL